MVPAGTFASGAGPWALRRIDLALESEPMQTYDVDTIEQQRVVMTVTELAAEECWLRLGQVPTGRLCFVEAGEPMVLAVNHAVDGHQIIVRTARGTTLHRIAVGRSVAYEADA